MLKLATIIGGGLVAATLLAALPAVAQPGGSYQDSCRRIEQRGPILQAFCRDEQGRMRRTRLDMRNCQGPVSNSDGRLTCGG